MNNDAEATAIDASVDPSRVFVAMRWNVVPGLTTVVLPSSSRK